MPEVKIGVYEKGLPAATNWAARFASAKQAGYDLVDISIDGSPERLNRLNWTKRQKVDFLHAALDAGIRLNAIALSAHRQFPMGSADPKIRERSLDIMHRAIDFVADLGFRTIQLAGYYVYHEEHVDDNYAYFCQSLAQAVEYAEQSGVMLGLENVDGQDILNIKQIMHFVELFKSPYLQAYPDIGNLAANGFDVGPELKKARGHLVGIHLKDVRENVFRRVSFGAGIVNFERAFRALAEMNYHGNFVIEMWNDNSPDALQIVSDSRQWILDRMMLSGLLPA